MSAPFVNFIYCQTGFTNIGKNAETILLPKRRIHVVRIDPEQSIIDRIEMINGVSAMNQTYLTGYRKSITRGTQPIAPAQFPMEESGKDQLNTD